MLARSLRREARVMSETAIPQLRVTGRQPQDNFQYIVLRVVPRVEREEFINAGVVLFCRTRSFLGAQVELNEALLTALSPDADGSAIRSQLRTYVRIADGDQGAGPVARLSQSERYHWLSAPSSTVVQTSPGHSGLCTDPEATLNALFEQLVL
jgi:hypothetical protein